MRKPKLLFLIASPAAFVDLAALLRSNGIDGQTILIGDHDCQQSSFLDLDLIVIEHLSTRPDSDLELARKVRETNSFVPIVLATTERSENLTTRALRMGLQGCDRLPISPLSFLSSFQRYLASGAQQKNQVLLPEEKHASGEMIIGCHAMEDIQ